MYPSAQAQVRNCISVLHGVRIHAVGGVFTGKIVREILVIAAIVILVL